MYGSRSGSRLPAESLTESPKSPRTSNSDRHPVRRNPAGCSPIPQSVLQFSLSVVVPFSRRTSAPNSEPAHASFPPSQIINSCSLGFAWLIEGDVARPLQFRISPRSIATNWLQNPRKIDHSPQTDGLRPPHVLPNWPEDQGHICGVADIFQRS
jgi:hypothetical protein